MTAVDPYTLETVLYAEVGKAATDVIFAALDQAIAAESDALRGPRGRKPIRTGYDMVVSGGDLYDALGGEPTGTRVLVVLPDGRELKVASGAVDDMTVTLPGGETVAGVGRVMRLIVQGPLISVVKEYRSPAGEPTAFRVNVDGMEFDVSRHTGAWTIGWMADWSHADRLLAAALVTVHTVGVDRTPWSHSEFRLVPAVASKILAAAGQGS